MTVGVWPMVVDPYPEMPSSRRCDLKQMRSEGCLGGLNGFDDLATAVRLAIIHEGD